MPYWYCIAELCILETAGCREGRAFLPGRGSNVSVRSMSGDPAGARARPEHAERAGHEPRFRLELGRPAARTMRELRSGGSAERKRRKVGKALTLLLSDPSYPSLRTHKHTAAFGPGGEELFGSYVEHRTPGAWRILWHYGPGGDVITVLAITPHP